MIVDFHTHILPSIDDGCRDTEIAVRMMEESAAQGIDLVVLTPHFYADEQSIDGFLDRRRNAFRRLTEALGGGRWPALLVGAELAYFRGCSESKRLSQLCISGMRERILLLEMPYRKWHSYEVDEIEAILDAGYTVVLAHIERFMSRDNRKHIARLDRLAARLERDYQLQCDASSGCLAGDGQKSVGQKSVGEQTLVGGDMGDIVRGAGRKSAGEQSLVGGDMIKGSRSDVGNGVLNGVLNSAHGVLNGAEDFHGGGSGTGAGHGRPRLVYQFNCSSIIDGGRTGGPKLVTETQDKGIPCLLGSDCHGSTSRPQNMQAARELLARTEGLAGPAMREIDRVVEELLER